MDPRKQFGGVTSTEEKKKERQTDRDKGRDRGRDPEGAGEEERKGRNMSTSHILRISKE